MDRRAACGVGVDVVNCSAVSKVTKYPKLSIAEALERWQL
jgi:hypothetical protein